MQTRTHKESSSVSPTSTHIKSNGSDGSRSFSAQRQPEMNSSPEQEIPSYSRNAADALIANVMRSMEEGEDSDEMSLEAGVQTKLTVGAAGDKYEQEADQVAAQVMSMSVAPDSSPQVQRFGEEDNPVQRWSLAQSITPVVQRRVDEQVQMRELVQRAFQAGGSEASGDLESRLNASKGGGSALAPEVRAFMEPRFGADFSDVRVHTGSEAVQMNRELGAQAFAHGSDVYFGAGKSPGNNALTAHELTHVVQQNGSQMQSFSLQKTMMLSKIQNADRASLQRSPATDSAAQPARLYIHADIDTEDFGKDALMEGEVGHAWISLEWKDKTAVPATLPTAHQDFLKRGGMFADPMGFWPKMFGSYDPLIEQWSNLPWPGQEPPGYTGETRVGYSSNLFKSYVPGQMLHPDAQHQATVKATRSYDLTEDEAQKVINYAEAKRGAEYSVYFYNCTTFAKEAVEAAGKVPPNSSTLAICYPNALFEGIKKNQKKGIGQTTIHGPSGNSVTGPEEKRKNS